MRIQDNVFLITGGASGLGAAAAQALVEAGGKVVLVDLDETAAQATAHALGANAFSVVADIRDETAARHAVSAARERFGALHGLVNCAGVAGGEKVLGRNGPHSLDSFSRIVGINLIGSFNMLRLAAEAMAENAPDEGGERGAIINTASIAAFDGQAGQAAYAASKAAIAGMTLPIARDLARSAIRVCAIAPGIFGTPMLRGLPQDVQDGLAAEVTNPKRLGDPEEFARLAAFIVENPYMNGETIRIDGALRMR